MQKKNTVTKEQIETLLNNSETQEHIYWDKELVISYRLPNGFTISGRGACVDPVNFDINIVREVAREDAENQLWKLEGYLLQDKLHDRFLKIAQVAHEVNKAYRESIGDSSQTSWEDAPEWQKVSAVNGVTFHSENPDADPESSHKSWYTEKLALGWVYGDVKDADAKTHPCMIPFEDLPKEQKAKDFIFRQIVHSLI